MTLWPFGRKKSSLSSDLTSLREQAPVSSNRPDAPSDNQTVSWEQDKPNSDRIAQDVPEDSTTGDQELSEQIDVEPDVPSRPEEDILEIDQLATALIQNSTLDREEFVRASATLKRLAETSPYAAERLKLIQREFFRKVRVQAEADYRSQQETLQFNTLKDQLLNDALILRWFNSRVDGERSADGNGWHGFSAEETEKDKLSQELADFIYNYAISSSALSSTFSTNTIEKASRACATTVIHASSILMKFLVDRDAALLPTMRRAIMTSKNKYGDPDYSGFFDEVDEFVCYAKSQVDVSVIPDSMAFRMVSNYFFRRVDLETREDDQLENIPIDGFEFEVWCAERIQSQGWIVEATPKSGDQGVDIVVRRGKVTVAVQCKRYQKPVGNSAVQEIHAGRTYVSANAAIVIATGGFTKSAQSLATISKVHLMDASDIGKFSELFGFEASIVEEVLIEEVLIEEFVSETYGQTKIVDMIFKGIDQMQDLVSEELNAAFKESFDQETGKGHYYFTPADALRILFTASAVLMSKIQLTEKNRLSLLGKGEDLNRALISDRSIEELVVYQIYTPDSNDLIVDAFRGYAKQFGVPQSMFGYLQEFDDS